jgi:oxepin-CoA hydrolase/3-oxo-5,6-dehydrosuberyl-CoA semialdehyde dehydrogenase
MIEIFEPYLRAMIELDPEREPRWGILTPHHMIEHVADTFRLTRTEFRTREVLESIPFRARNAFFRGYLRTALPIPRGVRHPVYGVGLRPLHTASIGEAVAELRDEIRELERFFELHPREQPIHPLFGPLDRTSWIRFHRKHTGHHCKQFGVVIPRAR